MPRAASWTPDRVPLVLVIPTYRRLDLLSTLLDGLIPQARAAGAAIIVGDNACEEAVAQHIAERAQNADIHYLPVPARGVSQVRNALIAEATRIAPAWEWVLMLDDDGIVTPGWLEALATCGETFDADLVGGPVTGVLPAGSGRLAHCSVFAGRKDWPTGLVPTLNTTQNLGISRRILDRLTLPLFSNWLGASGGEDYELFRRTARHGGKLAWCGQAEIIEPAPPERLTMRSLLYRYFSTGIYMARIDVAYDGWYKGAIIATKGLGKTCLGALSGGLSGQLDMAARNALMIAHYLGRIAGLAGARSARYVKKKDLA